jgi:hypothetical protein
LDSHTLLGQRQILLFGVFFRLDSGGGFMSLMAQLSPQILDDPLRFH